MNANRKTGTRAAALGFALAIAATMTACSSDDTGSTDANGTVATTVLSSAVSSPASTADPAAGLVGPGCAAYAQEVPTGPGSLAGMATEPVTVAASNNPLLTTLAAAVSGQLNPDVNLVATLDGGEFTVFAPVDAAFAKVDPATIEALKTDAEALSSLLTYHVVPGQVAPDKIAGLHTTVQGETVQVNGAGDDLKINDAGVICGGVRTANATVYLIDQVLMPPAE